MITKIYTACMDDNMIRNKENLSWEVDPIGQIVMHIFCALLHERKGIYHAEECKRQTQTQTQTQTPDEMRCARQEKARLK